MDNILLTVAPADVESQGIDHALIGPRDNRVHVADTRRFPYNTICYLGRDFGDGRLRGCTGTLIAPRMVLTAGHCLFSHRRKRSPVRISVIPGRSGRKIKPYGSIVSSEYYIPRKYLHRQKNSDYGVILLPRAFADLKRFMPVIACSDRQSKNILRNHRVAIAGYPGDRPVGTLWRHTEYLRRISPLRLYYTVDTCPGHSGSPVWFYNPRKRKRYIIGVHTSGIVDEWGRSFGCSPATILAPPGALNSGIRVTPRVRTHITRPKDSTGRRGTMVRLP